MAAGNERSIATVESQGRKFRSASSAVTKGVNQHQILVQELDELLGIHFIGQPGVWRKDVPNNWTEASFDRMRGSDDGCSRM
jgi:hypothetical protein